MLKLLMETNKKELTTIFFELFKIAAAEITHSSQIKVKSRSFSSVTILCKQFSSLLRDIKFQRQLRHPLVFEKKGVMPKFPVIQYWWRTFDALWTAWKKDMGYCTEQDETYLIGYWLSAFILENLKQLERTTIEKLHYLVVIQTVNIKSQQRSTLVQPHTPCSPWGTENQCDWDLVAILVSIKPILAAP